MGLKGTLVLSVHCMRTAVVGQQRGPRKEDARSSSLRCLCSWEDREIGRGAGVPRGQQEHVCVFLVTTAAMEQSFNVAPRLGG